MFTMRPESAYGKGRRTTALTIVKIAVFAAMPMASAATAVMVKLGLCRSTRIECLTSFRKDSILRPPRFECNERSQRSTLNSIDAGWSSFCWPFATAPRQAFRAVANGQQKLDHPASIELSVDL